MKMNWFVCAGIAFIALIEGSLISQIGQEFPGYTSDFMQPLVWLVIAGVPFVLGYVGGKREIWL